MSHPVRWFHRVRRVGRAGTTRKPDIFFSFAMPVGFRREMAGVRNVQLRLAREKAQLEDMELNTVHLLSTAVRNVDSNYVLAESHFNRWSAAEKEVESVNALYRGGKQTVDLVLEAQRRRAEARSPTTRRWSITTRPLPKSISARARCWNTTTSNWRKATGRRRRTGTRWDWLASGTPATT